MYDIEERVTRLLDQLENPTLKPFEVQALKDKIEFLQSLHSE